MPDPVGLDDAGDCARGWVNQVRAFGVLVGGAPRVLHAPSAAALPAAARQCRGASYYDTAPLRATLERLVDFDLLNAGADAASASVRSTSAPATSSISIHATHRIGPEHIIASGSLPPGFPATEIEGEHYWDGGLVSNTPLQWVLDSRPRADTLAFQVDLWSAKGELPRDLIESEVRQKEIRYSSRTRSGTDQFKRAQQLRRAFARLLQAAAGRAAGVAGGRSCCATEAARRSTTSSS